MGLENVLKMILGELQLIFTILIWYAIALVYHLSVIFYRDWNGDIEFDMVIIFINLAHFPVIKFFDTFYEK